MAIIEELNGLADIIGQFGSWRCLSSTKSIANRGIRFRAIEDHQLCWSGIVLGLATLLAFR